MDKIQDYRLGEGKGLNRYVVATCGCWGEFRRGIFYKKPIRYIRDQIMYHRIIKNLDRFVYQETENLSNVNFYRDDFYDESNRRLVQLCKDGNSEAIQAWYMQKENDTYYFDEYLSNRMSLRIIAKYIKRKEKSIRILDVACGHAEIDIFLTKIGYKCSAVDMNEERILYGKKYLDDIRCENIENMTFEKSSFDCVICCEVLEHVINLDKALSSIYLVLRDKGELLLTVPNGYMIEDSGHVRIFTEQKLVDCLINKGFWIRFLGKAPYLNHERNNDLLCIARK